MKNHKLTLGPCLFNWKVNDWRDFYFKIAEESIVDEVYIGEVVCYKRYPFFEVALDDVINRLESCGKKVNLSGFSLILGDLEMNTSKKFIDKAKNNRHLIEINDVGLLGLLKDTPHIIGPTINVYNESTMETLVEQGAKRVCFPYEIDNKSLAILSQVKNCEKEIFAFGRMPLAIAARCYHARIHKTQKDDCKYVCEKDYDGKPITTLMDENFLVVNGTQTMSFSYNNLINELDELIKMGINVFRISPHYMDMVSVISIFNKVLLKQIQSVEAISLLKKLMPNDAKFSNGFYYSQEGRNFNNPFDNSPKDE